jgi:acetyl esterase/lipase
MKGTQGNKTPFAKSAPPLLFLAVSLTALSCSETAASPGSELDAVIEMSRHNHVLPGIVYRTVKGKPVHLDVLRTRAEGDPMPALIYIHGGGWNSGSKEKAMLHTTPFLARGWVVVNVEYRLAQAAEAPAAVEDCICAVKFIAENAKKYRIDTNRIVVMGHSAGGHLALMTAFAPSLGRVCPGEMPRIRAVVNWFGISDVADLLEGENKQQYAIDWAGKGPRRSERARISSPLTHVKADVPPVISIHGELDKGVPFSQSERLHAALQKAGVDSVLRKIEGAGHGGFSREAYRDSYHAVFAFVDAHLP